MKRRVCDFLYNLDRALASLMGSSPQETLSSEIGRAKLRGVWWGKTGYWVLNCIQKDHCENAILHADALDRADNGLEN